MMKFLIWIISCLTFFLSFFILGNGIVCAAEKLVLQLPWHHQFQFAGYYMAKEKGYYNSAGLDVEVRDANQKNKNVVNDVLFGQADFAISDSGLLVSRSQGKPVVAISAIFPSSPAIFLSLKESGIRTPADLAGKKVMLFSSPRSSSLYALLSQEGLLGNIEIIESNFDVNSLLDEQVDVFNAYRTNEPYLLEAQGEQTNIIDPSDYGIEFYGDVLFTSEMFLEKNPKVVEEFRKASLKGWDYALNHFDETIAVIKEKYQADKTIQQLQFEAAAIKEIIETGEGEIGAMDLARWAQIVHHMIAINLIPPTFHMNRNFLYEESRPFDWVRLRPWIVGAVAAFSVLIVFLSILSKSNVRLRAVRKQLLQEIEEREQVEKVLSLERDNLKDIFGAMEDGIYIVDKEFDIQYVNPVLINDFGDYTGKKCYEYFHDQRENCLWCKNTNVQRGETVRWEWYSAKIDKTYDLIDTPLKQSDGSILKLGMLRDITARKQADVALRKSEERFKRLSDVTFEGIMIHDEGVAVEVNESLVKMFGYSREEMIGNVLYRLFIPEEYHSIIEENFAKKVVAPYEVIARRKDGTLFPLEVESRNIKGDRYQVIAVRDITVRKQAQIERERLSLAIEQSSETIVITDKEGIIQYANPAFEKISGYTCEEVIGKNPRILKSDLQDITIYPKLWKTLTDGEIWRGRFINKKKDGEIYLENATISPVFDAFGRVSNYIAVKRDITHEVEMEGQLRQKYKMEAIGLMAGGIAHNFNNNLAIILGNVELTQLKLPEYSGVGDYLKNAKIAVMRSRDLVQQILTYSREGGHDKTPTQLPLLIEETLNLLHSTTPTTIDLLQDINENSRDTTINADASQVQEALINLCNNAMHAMDEKGELRVSLETVQLQYHDIPAQYECLPGCYAKLSVQDDGSGMSPETVDKIFDPFFTTKEVDEGTGMGLATVQGIMNQHGGLIKVSSNLNKGTTFDLFFPVSEQPQTAELTSANRELPRGTERILFLDDDEMLSHLGEMMLSEAGYQVTAMTSSIEVLKLFNADPNRFDLVITDQTMPDLSGKDLIQELLKVRPDLVTILCTGFSNKIDKDEAKKLGISAFCMKPLNLPELVQTVRRVLDTRRA